jgi:hypothetical protein
MSTTSPTIDNTTAAAQLWAKVIDIVAFAPLVKSKEYKKAHAAFSLSLDKYIKDLTLEEMISTLEKQLVLGPLATKEKLKAKKQRKDADDEDGHIELTKVAKTPRVRSSKLTAAIDELIQVLVPAPVIAVPEVLPVKSKKRAAKVTK